MKSMTETETKIDRISPTKQPSGRPIGHQTWSDLLFIHWQVSPSELSELIPERLNIDTFEGKAWVGLVPFHMSGVRPWWFPPVPGISSFHETNLRTYVHLDGKDPGVWFFSLDASSSLAVRIARWKWKLNYYCSAMQLHRTGRNLRYESERLWPGVIGPGTKIEAEYGDLIGGLDKEIPAGQAVPGTLEHFLTERYFLYAQIDDGPLHQGQVHHKPYPLNEARVIECHERLRKLSNVPQKEDIDHVLFSEGVDVQIYPLKPV